MNGPDILARLTERFGAGVLASHAEYGDHTLLVDRAALPEVLRFCRDDPGLRFDMLMDLTAVDYLTYPGREEAPRFEVVYHLYSVPYNHRLRIKAGVEEDDPVVPTAVPLWPIADWFEREVWDMFGLRFAEHPDLRRLLLYEQFEGHPLRKDYPVSKRQPLIGPRN
jgi:NADH-quinone oxidoreductase subunit C